MFLSRLGLLAVLSLALCHQISIYIYIYHYFCFEKQQWSGLVYWPMQPLVSLMSLVSLCVCVRVCVPHTYICISRLNQEACWGLLLEPMEHPRCRSDELKVFLGNLRPNVIKPEVMNFLTGRFPLSPVEVIVPGNSGPTAIAFAIFDSPEEASDCIALCNGKSDDISIGKVHAHRGANMWVFTAVVSMPQNI